MHKKGVWKHRRVVARKFGQVWKIGRGKENKRNQTLESIFMDAWLRELAHGPYPETRLDAWLNIFCAKWLHLDITLHK